MINGAFSIIQILGRYLFIRREDNGLWEIPGGGFETNETEFTEIAAREILEEIGLHIPIEHLNFCAILSQRLKREVSCSYGGVEYGFAFLHNTTLHHMPSISLSDEHTEFRLFSYEEILHEWKSFSSGPLWMFFTYLAFQNECKIQRGKLFDRRIWQKKEYLEKVLA